jgi:acyl-CoA synthetase (NDP forming)
VSPSRETTHSLEHIVSPRSVAIIGASATPGKWGHEILKGIVTGGYAGRVYPVNPKGGEMLGLRAYARVSDIEGPVDLAIIGTQAQLVLDSVRDCREKGVKGVVVISAGFRETGESGRNAEEELVREAGSVRIIGPNTMGIMNLSIDFNATFLHPLKGKISILTQGGNVAVEAEYNARKRGIGFNKLFHVGNQSDLSIPEFLDCLKDDRDTEVILLYIEGLQEKGGEQLARIAKEVTRIKPIVVLKTGVTKAGSRGALSHTGSLAGEDRIYGAAFKQVGMIRVATSHELINVGEALLKAPIMRGNKFGVLTDGGSHSAMGCDAASRYGLELPFLSEETQERLRDILLPQSIRWNPVDFAGAADADLRVFPRAAELMLQDDNVDGLLIAGAVFGGYSAWFGAGAEEEVAHLLVDLPKKYGKPVVLHNYFGVEDSLAVQIMSKGGIPVYPIVEDAARCLAALAEYGLYLEKARRVSGSISVGSKIRRRTSVDRIVKGVAATRGSLLETEAKGILREYGIPVTDFELAANGEQAVSIARRFGYPVAMKVVSPQIVHKTDAGGIKLDLKADEEVSKAFDNIVENVKKYDKDAQLEGVMISPMEREGAEVIVGATRDPQFGPVIMFGLGGVFVEVLKDVAFRIVPVERRDAYEMIKEVKGYPVLEGVRGQKGKDIEALADIILKVSNLVTENEVIRELDLNPIFVFERGASVVDARMILSQKGPS